MKNFIEYMKGFTGWLLFIGGLGSLIIQATQYFNGLKIDPLLSIAFLWIFILGLVSIIDYRINTAKKSSKLLLENYFLSFFFKWEDIFKMFEIPKEEWSDFTISKEYNYVPATVTLAGYLSSKLKLPPGVREESKNPESTFPKPGINNETAMFEYYVRSGDNIFDQQLKRFFVDPNINYGSVLINSKKTTSSFVCFFDSDICTKFAPDEHTPRKAGFTVCYSNEGRWKAIIFLFDGNFLNKGLIPSYGYNKIQFEAYEISDGGRNDNNFQFHDQAVTKKLSLDSHIVWGNVLTKSLADTGADPFSYNLVKFLDPEGVAKFDAEQAKRQKEEQVRKDHTVT